MYIYYTMAPGTDAKKSSQALTWIYALVTQRTSTTRCIQRAEPSYGHGEMWRLHGTARLPAESSLLELPTQSKFQAYLRYLQRLPAELLQLLNLPVVPQLGGEGASLGPTRQLRTRTWELYIHS